MASLILSLLPRGGPRQPGSCRGGGSLSIWLRMERRAGGPPSSSSGASSSNSVGIEASACQHRRRRPRLDSAGRVGACGAHRRSVKNQTVCGLSWDPAKFDANKLTVKFSGDGSARRRYTLTHNDLTGQLSLSVGEEFNRAQVSGWCALCLGSGLRKRGTPSHAYK